MSHIQIFTGPKDTDATVILDGQNISKGLRGYEISHMSPGRPAVNLHPAVFERTTVDLEADVYISPEASDLLIRMGWTPPGGAS